jgi:hypothetical protein
MLNILGMLLKWDEIRFNAVKSKTYRTGTRRNLVDPRLDS